MSDDASVVILERPVDADAIEIDDEYNVTNWDDVETELIARGLHDGEADEWNMTPTTPDDSAWRDEYADLNAGDEIVI